MGRVNVCRIHVHNYLVEIVVESMRDHVEGVVKEYGLNFGDYFGVQTIETADCKEVAVVAEAKMLFLYMGIKSTKRCSNSIQ